MSRKRYVDLYDMCKLFLIPWTKGTGSGIALSMNPESPLEAQLMLSHSWAEDMDECQEALRTFAEDACLSDLTPVWFCAFSQYQAGGEQRDVGPTVQEQVAMDPFGCVIKCVHNKLGVLVIHTSQAEVYSRLWCVYEIAVALRCNSDVLAACSVSYGKFSRGMLMDVLKVSTAKARCSNPCDEAWIRCKVKHTGGFARLDQEIFQFRVQMLRHLALRGGSLRELEAELEEAKGKLELDNGQNCGRVTRKSVIIAVAVLLVSMAAGIVVWSVTGSKSATTEPSTSSPAPDRKDAGPSVDGDGRLPLLLVVGVGIVAVAGLISAVMLLRRTTKLRTTQLEERLAHATSIIHGVDNKWVS